MRLSPWRRPLQTSDGDYGRSGGEPMAQLRQPSHLRIMKLLLAWVLGVPLSLLALSSVFAVSRADLLGTPVPYGAPAPEGRDSTADESRVERARTIETRRDAAQPTRTTISWTAPSKTRSM